MGKKTAPQLSKSKSRQKRKEMFSELATLKEQMIQQQDIRRRPHNRTVIMDDSQEQIQLQVLEHENKNLDVICETVYKLLSKNKVSAKNAFNVPLIDLEQLPDFNQSLENEHAWKRLSSTLQSDYKIYGYRVDAIHSITYSILNTMSRRQQEVDAPVPEKQTQGLNPGHEQPIMKISDQPSEGEYLQKKIQNLNLIELQLVTRTDPVLERTKRQFDLLGQNSMMMDSLPLDEMLCLQLVRRNQGKQKYPPWGFYNDQWKSQDPLMAFIGLSSFRAQARQILERFIPSEDLDFRMADQDMPYLFLEEKENYFDGNYDFESQFYAKSRRSIDKELYMRSSFMKAEREGAYDAEKWLQDINRNFLGRKNNTNTNRQQNIENSQIPRQDLADMIDFQEWIEEQRDSVFKPDPNKLEHHEDIQDRFLVAPKLPTQFHVEFQTFLREKQSPLKPKNAAGPQKEAEVDVRRQMISILQAKKKIRDQIHSRSTFSTIYRSYCYEQQISPALCFLTILHLANEHDLTLKEIDESNFYIY